MTSASVAIRPAKRDHLGPVPATHDASPDGREMTALAARVAADSGRLIDRTNTCVSEARTALGMTLAEFADYMRRLTGWDVLPEAYLAWEDDVIPPGDIVIVCLALTGQES